MAYKRADRRWFGSKADPLCPLVQMSVGAMTGPRPLVRFEDEFELYGVATHIAKFLEGGLRSLQLARAGGLKSKSKSVLRGGVTFAVAIYHPVKRLVGEGKEMVPERPPWDVIMFGLGLGPAQLCSILRSVQNSSQLNLFASLLLDWRGRGVECVEVGDGG